MGYLDNKGLTYFWGKIKTLVGTKSDKGHTHSYNDLSNKPTIPTIPSSLPANGGNADTVDGMHINIAHSAPTNADFSIITIVL